MNNESNPNKKIESDIKKLRTGKLGEIIETLRWYWLV